MIRTLLLLLALACTAPALGQEPNPFPPLGTRYDTIPDDAKAVVKALKKIQARTEIGTSFKDYDSAVSDAYPEVKVFIESRESEDMPELRRVLKNAIDCYLKVREVWSIKIDSDSPAKQYEASTLLITAQPLLWQVAAGNISAANALIESPKEDLPKAQQLLVESLETLDAARALERAKGQGDELLKKQQSAERNGDVASPVDDALPNELQRLLFNKEDYGREITGSKFNSAATEVNLNDVDVVSRESVSLVCEGKVGASVLGDTSDFFKEGYAQITGFVFSDATHAKQGYTDLRARMGKGGGSEHLGTASWSKLYGDGHRETVFRRGNFLIFARADEVFGERLLNGLQAVDNRIKKRIASEK